MKNAFKFIPLCALALHSIAHANVMDANKENFARAVQQKLDRENGVCLRVIMDKTPFSISEERLKHKPENSQQLDALVKVGLLTKKEEPIKVAEDKEEAGFTYELTEMGRKFKKPNTHKFKPKFEFCSGRLKVTRIDNFSDPVEKRGHTKSRVNFHTKVESADDWIKDEVVHDAYRKKLDLDKILTEESAGLGVLFLTEHGWIEASLYDEQELSKPLSHTQQ